MWKKSLKEFNQSINIVCAAIGFVVGGLLGVFPGLCFGAVTESALNGVLCGAFFSLLFAYWGYRDGDGLTRMLSEFVEALKEGNRGRRL